MNDKIQITTKEFQKNDLKFKENFTNETIQFLKFNNSDDDLLNNAYNNSNKIYCNNDILNVTINPKGLQIAFNPNRLMNVKPAFEVLDYTQFKQSFDLVQNELQNIGIDTNISNKPIYRFHSSFDLETDKQFSSYIGLIKTFLPHSIKTRYNHKFSIQDTLYKEISKNQKVVLYDKTKLYNKMNPENRLETDVMRIEYRNENEIKLQRLSINNITKDRYYKIRMYHKELIKENIFNVNIIESSNLLSLFSNLILNKINRSEIYKYLSSFSLNQQLIENDLVLKDVINSLIDNNDDNYRRQLRNLIKDMNMYPVFNSDFVNELYTEILYKFNKVA